MVSLAVGCGRSEPTATGAPPAPSPAISAALQATVAARWAAVVDAAVRRDAAAFARVATVPLPDKGAREDPARHAARSFACTKPPSWTDVNGQMTARTPSDEQAERLTCLVGPLTPSAWSAAFVKVNGEWMFAGLSGGE